MPGREVHAVKKRSRRVARPLDSPARCTAGRVIEDWYIDRVSHDQSPSAARASNPAPTLGLFAPLRELFAQVPESRARGYGSGRFSFNVKGGRCEACQGDGVIRVEMHFLPDVYVPCDVCQGRRYNRETLEIRYRGKNIHEVLQMTIEEANTFFSAVPMIASNLQP